MGTFRNVSKKYLHLTLLSFNFGINNRLNDYIFVTAIRGVLKSSTLPDKKQRPANPETMMIEIAPSENQMGSRMWPSLEVASKIADWANVFFIASLVMGVVSTILIVWMANVKEAHWDVLRRQSDEKIAEANARAKQAELALQIRTNPRFVDPNDLKAALAGKPTAQPEVWFVVECTDCEWFARWILVGLREAGWNVVSARPQPLPSPPPGTVPFSSAVAKGGQPWNLSILSNDMTPGSAGAELYDALLKLIGRMGGAAKAPDMADGVVRIIVAPRP